MEYSFIRLLMKLAMGLRKTLVFDNFSKLKQNVASPEMLQTISDANASSRTRKSIAMDCVDEVGLKSVIIPNIFVDHLSYSLHKCLVIVVS